MITTVSEFKEFIEWAKSQKLKSVSIGDAKFEFSELAFISDLQDLGSPSPDISVPPSSKRLPDSSTQTSEDDPDLFWSSGS